VLKFPGSGREAAILENCVVIAEGKEDSVASDGAEILLDVDAHETNLFRGSLQIGAR